MMVVAVHTEQLYVLAIDLEYFAHALYAFYTEMIVEVLHGITITVRKFYAERIEIRMGSRPKARVVDGVF